jgi:TonB family protein
MVKTSLILFLWGAMAAFPQTTGGEGSDRPVIETLAIPPYPYLARLAGTEGTIQAKVTLDEKCNVGEVWMGKGPESLEDAVILALGSHSLPLRFRPCISGGPRDIQLSYVFLLEGKATNDWLPTSVSISGNGSSLTIKITTAPADLGALGLEKRPGEESSGGAKAGPPAPQDISVDLPLPRYPPLAHQAHVQGDVKVAAKLDSKCEVSSAHVVLGHALLNSEVLRAVRRWRFPSCSAGGDEEITLTFHFALSERDETLHDDWAPTRFDIIRAYEFQIKTTEIALVILN